MNSKNSQSKTFLKQLFNITLGAHANIVFFLIVTHPFFYVINKNELLKPETSVLTRTASVIILASFFTFNFNRLWQKILEEEGHTFNKTMRLSSDILGIILPPVVAYVFFRA